MTSERTLRKWRKHSLKEVAGIKALPKEGISTIALDTLELHYKILQLTQELMDKHLMEGK